MAGKPATIGLLALVVLAGCGGVGLQRPPTVTPVAVPMDSPAGLQRTGTSPATIAPGLSREGVTDPLALARAHAAVLDSTSFRVRIEQTVRDGNGTARDRQLLEGAFANETVYWMRVRRVSDGEEIAHWSVYADGEQLYQQLVHDEAVHYYLARSSVGSQADYPAGTLGGPIQRRQLFSLLAGTEPALGESVRGVSQPQYRVRSAGRAYPVFLATSGVVDAITVVEFAAFVRADGLVTGYRLDGTGPTDGGAWHVTRKARWYAVGNTTVEPPWWYPIARAKIDG